jgi:hypothetical protein
MAERPRLWQRLLDIVRRAFTPLALIFLVLAAYSAREAFAQVLAQARLAPLLLTVVAWSSMNLLLPVITWIVLRGLGVRIDYATALRIHVARLPARYLPGGIWQTVSRMMDLHQLGVGRSQLSVLVMVENLGSLATAVTAGGLCVLLSGTSRLPTPAIIGTGVLLAAGLPWVLRRIFGRTALRLPAYLAALATLLSFWMLTATTFVIYWSAFPALEHGNLLDLYGAYLLAWAVGFVAVFAPQGIGVFEMVAAVLLRGELPLAGMAVLVAGFRAATLSGDALAFMLGRLVRWTTASRRANMQ